MNDTEQSDITSSVKGAAAVAGSVAADLRSAASERLDGVMTEVKAQADDVKASVAGQVNDVATALRNASQTLKSGSAQERTLGQIANGLADASDALRDKDMGEIVQMVSSVARRNPVLFMGGAVLLGFAATRYAKATGPTGGGKSVDVGHHSDLQGRSAEQEAYGSVDTMVAET